jgi:hypothetical protein
MRQARLQPTIGNVGRAEQKPCYVREGCGRSSLALVCTCIAAALRMFPKFLGTGVHRVRRTLLAPACRSRPTPDMHHAVHEPAAEALCATRA